MIRDLRVPLFELVNSLSSAVDLISPIVANHHKQVAYISLRIGKELGLPVENISDLVIASTLHDIGALSLRERLDALQFEIDHPHEHAEVGYNLLRSFAPFTGVARIVKHHHVSWNNADDVMFKGEIIPAESHILHLADRVSVLINKDSDVFSQVNHIIERIAGQSGKMFDPEAVEAFRSIAGTEYFWLDAVSGSIDAFLSNYMNLKTVSLDLDGMLNLANVFSNIIDFRCRFTANHSAGVAVASEKLARLAGFSESESKMMKVAGYLHDLGKLAVPVEIINKPGGLTSEEYQIIKSHTYYTYRVLEPIRELGTITAWASFHHERLDGFGYPFRLNEKDLSLGSRIMAVADVFTALTEDRPYRAGLGKDKVLQILQEMAEKKALDANVVSLLKQNFEEVNMCRLAEQAESAKHYSEVIR